MKKCTVLRLVIISLLFSFITANATVWYVHPDSKVNSMQTGINSSGTAAYESYPRKEIELFSGWIGFESNLPSVENYVYGGRIGYSLSESFEIEAELSVMPPKEPRNFSGNIQQAGVNVLYNFLRNNTQFFVFGGFGLLRFIDYGVYDSVIAFALNYGIGIKYPILYPILRSHFLIRADIRDYVISSIVFTHQVTHNLQVTGGLVFWF